MKKKQILSGAMAVAMAASLAACGGAASTDSQPASTAESTAASTEAASAENSSDEPVTIRITWWGGQARHDYTQQMLDLYTSEHPNVTFEAVPAGWDGYFDKLATDTATGGMADIVQMDYMYIATYANNNSLADMSEFVADGTLDLSTVDDSLLSSGTINGKLVGVPLSTSILAMSYNPAVLEEAGVEVPTNDWTWDDFGAAITQIHDKTGKVGFSGSAVDNLNVLNYWVRQHGAQLFADDNKSLGYDDDSIVTEYFQYWKDLTDAGAVPNPDEFEQITALGKDADPTITGDAGIRQDWNNFTVRAAVAGNDTLKLLNMPVNSQNTKALWYKPGMYFSVAETSTVKKACAEFIDWFLNSDEANDIMLGERGTPASGKARDHLIDSGKLNQQQIDMFNFATDVEQYCSECPAPDPSGISEINTAFKDIGYGVFYGQTTPEEAAKQFREQITAILVANN